MFFTKQKYYETGSKFTKLLARKLQKQKADSTIHKIRNPITKDLVYKREEIQSAFQNYYKELYSQSQLEEEQNIKTFLNSLNLPILNEQQNKELTAKITEEELDKAISRLKTNKSPGPDGFSSEWYKVFRTELKPYLLHIFNKALKEGKIPPTWKEATITVIPKDGKDQLECGSFRPISILNIDYKLYTSILARRVEKVLPQLIHTDQTGFVPQRQTHDNIRRSLHVLSHIQEHKLQALLISLDAEKAFDSVSWEFLYLVLEKFGFHKNFVNAINSLYNNPTARVKINGHLSKIIKLERGTRQGCGMSPLLFALFIEPLAQWIRQTDNIKGINIDKDKHKVALYADDILVYLTEPTKSLPELFKLLEQYGKYAGYKLNIQKTQTLKLNYNPPIELKKRFHMKWDQEAIKYLGILLPKDITTTKKINYDPLINKLKTDIARWNSNPFMSLTQRIEAIKMNILPRILYLFQALPVEIKPQQFNEWDKILSRFIWQGKKPRVRFKTLQLPKKEGGMAVPHLRNYFYSTQIKPLLNLCNPEYNARWKDIEKTLIKDSPIQAVLGNKEIKQTISKLKNPWLKFQLKIWNTIKTDYKLLDKLWFIRWIAYDPDFKPNQLDLRFKTWTSKGISTYYSLTNKGILKDFQTLKREFSLEQQDFYRFLQLRNYFDKCNKPPHVDLEDAILKEFLRSYSNESIKGAISRLYKGLLTKKPYTTEYIKNKWEKEGQLDITKEEWLNYCEILWRCTSAHTWREFAWKCLIRFFTTPKKKFYYTGEDPKCWRGCGDQDANHWHVFWKCPGLQNFWSGVHKTMEEIFHIKIPNQFETFILGKSDFITGNTNRYLFIIMVTVAKKNITRHWLHPESPTVSEWMDTIDDIYRMEKITHSLNLQMERFDKIWSKWISFVEKRRPNRRDRTD